MKKIMFNDQYKLTQAVLERRKTQTRRIIDIDEVELTLFQTLYFNETFDYLEGKDLIEAYFDNNPKKIPYKKGEVVAVAQKYSEVFNPIDWVKPKIYEDTKAWNNNMNVRPDLMPHQIRITNVRIERLQDITDEDCLKEGVCLSKTDNRIGCPIAIPFNYYIKEDTKRYRYTIPREAYTVLINKISGKGTWERNPYVFVYDFELVK